MKLTLLSTALIVVGKSLGFTGPQQSIGGNRGKTIVLSTASYENNNENDFVDLVTSPYAGDGAKKVMKRKEIVMSKALPFFQCPEPLIECDLAGNCGFDPLGFVKGQEDLMYYREAEIKHARLAMLAAAGWPLSELFDKQIAEYLNLPPVIDSSDRVPSLLNGGLDTISPVWWGCCLGMTAAIDNFGIAKSRSGDISYFPGKLDFDPLNLYPTDIDARKRMELAEIKHGRIAMIAVVGYAIQEFVTQLGVIDETPFFFRPLFDVSL